MLSLLLAYFEHLSIVAYVNMLRHYVKLNNMYLPTE